MQTSATLITLDVRTRGEWRKWLAKHHASSHGIWLIRHKPHTGVKSMPYEDLVREALCFGWVDSLIKRTDENRYSIKVTPRQPTSKWSDLNRKRWKALGYLRSLRTSSTHSKRTPMPGNSFRHFRPGTAVISWSGFIQPGDLGRGNGTFASLLNCSRPERNWV